MPEAWDGGPIAAVRDGEIIEIDIDARTIHAEIYDEKITERMKTVKRPDHPAKGILAACHKMLESADKVCTWIFRD